MSSSQTKADRQKISDRVQASSALEGYEPLTLDDGVPYILQQEWIDGKITLEESKQKLLEHYADMFLAE